MKVCVQGGWLCPRLPFGWCPRLWDEAHVPGVEEDDVAIYGEALARRKHWPLWMLLVRHLLLPLEHLCRRVPAGAHRKCTRLRCTVCVTASHFCAILRSSCACNSRTSVPVWPRCRQGGSPQASDALSNGGGSMALTPEPGQHATTQSAGHFHILQCMCDEVLRGAGRHPQPGRLPRPCIALESGVFCCTHLLHVGCRARCWRGCWR